MRHIHTLCRHLLVLIVAAHAFSWSAAVFAQNDTYCTCIADTCRSGACDYAGCAEAFPDHPALVTCKHPIWLLQPLDDTTYEIQPQSGAPFGAFKQFFDIAWPWIIGVAAGIAVLWAIVGGIEIMLSGSDSGMRDQGKGRFISALTGLLIVGLAGLILEILNPFYYTQ